MSPADVPELTRWQERRRRRRAIVDRLTSLLFAVLLVAAFAYFFGIGRMIVPWFFD